MRNSYLESYYNMIPETQQKRLLEVLKSSNQSENVVIDTTTLQTELEKLILQLKQPLGSPLVQYRPSEKYGKMSSSDYNSTMREVYADLGGVFKQNNNINRTIFVHRGLDKSIISDVKSALIKIENDIKVYEVVKENKTGITDAIYNSFHRDDNQSESKSFKVWTDLGTDSIKLPIGVDHSSLSVNGLAMAEIDIVKYGGGITGTMGNEDHNKERAIDGDDATFWGEVILTDEPIRQSYEGEDVFGIVCEVVISLYRPEQVNYIRFNPYTKYPVKVMKIKYRESITDEWTDIGITPKTSTSIMEFNFNEVRARQIKIVINQQNVSINTYKIPRRMVNNNQLWQQIADREYSVSTDSDAPTQATQDMIDYITGWRAYVDASSKYAEGLLLRGKPEDFIYKESFSESIFDASTEQILEASKSGAESLKMNLYGKKGEKNDVLVEVRKYEYIYGAFSIDVKNIWYTSIGEYISPKYSTNGPVMEAMLDTTDVVPSGTTIEYQLATRDGEWKEILPNASGIINKIIQERVDIDPISQAGTLRFTCSGVPDSVYFNGNILASGNYSYLGSSNQIVVASGNFVNTASYTASYTVSGSSDIVPSGTIARFSGDSLITSDEIFTDNDSRQYKIELSHFPYIDYRAINDTSNAGKSNPNFEYTDGRWYNQSASGVYGILSGEYYDVLTVTVDGFTAENMTDYYEDIRPALTQYSSSSYPNYEYFHSGKNLYFNTLLSDKEVKVSYDYLNDFIQLRVLLRNNLRSTITKTPVCQDYTIKLRTL